MMAVLWHLRDCFIIEHVQFTHIPRLPGLVPPTVVDDRGLLPHVLQRHAVPVAPVEGEQLLRHVIADGIQRQDALAVQGTEVQYLFCCGICLSLRSTLYLLSLPSFSDASASLYISSN